ncbi:hypothetical protein LTS12_029122, partial [Elasticomyces elasticus]
MFPRILPSLPHSTILRSQRRQRNSPLSTPTRKPPSSANSSESRTNSTRAMKNARRVLKLGLSKRKGAKAIGRTCAVVLDVAVGVEETETGVEIGVGTTVV